MSAIKSPVNAGPGTDDDRGIPPTSFLNELIDWARMTELSVFDRNDVDVEMFTLIRPKLGPWHETPGEPIPFIFHRRAALMEAMRVHAGYESSWNWNEGVDRTNQTSVANITGQETGIFQVSYDSTLLGGPTRPMKKYLDDLFGKDSVGPQFFIEHMKKDHVFALDYYARLVRVNIKWAGPLLHGLIIKDLNPDAVEEFKNLLATPFV